jgi:hypothetical protein
LNRQNEYEKYVNQKRQDATFNIGQKVLVRRFPKKKGLSKKLFHTFYGLYIIVQKKSDVNYIVEAKRRNKTYRETVHIKKLKPCYDAVDDITKLEAEPSNSNPSDHLP